MNATIPASQARAADWCNRGISVKGVTNRSLFGSEAHFAGCCGPRERSMVGETIGTRGKLTTFC